MYQEGPGSIQESSLAAESARSGGGFSENRGIGKGDDQQYDSGPGAGDSSGGGGGSAGLRDQRSYGGAAPSYIQSQYQRDPSGPHGKNLQEGGFEGSDRGESLRAEPGSKKDPGRAAEMDLKLSQAKAGRDAGPRQHGVEGEQPYQILQSDSPA
jgi:hypothetical protein